LGTGAIFRDSDGDALASRDCVDSAVWSSPRRSPPHKVPMKKLKIAGLVLVRLFIVLTAAGFLAAKVRIARSVMIKAPLSDIYPRIASYKTGWDHWNPFSCEEKVGALLAGRIGDEV
jgi:hypothetical protein